MQHFFCEPLDKSFQKADWGIRPLSPAHLYYAAADTEWCHAVHQRLLKLPGAPAADVDDPHVIQSRYLEILPALKDARDVRSSIRDPVKDLMVHQALTRLARFVLQKRSAHSTSLAALVDFAQETDPGRYLDLKISLSARLRAIFGEAIEDIRPFADIHFSEAFRGPRTPRAPKRHNSEYVIGEIDVERLTLDYEEAEHQVHLLDSERTELRNRMKAWMDLEGLRIWSEFRFSEPRERWKIDVRALKGTIPSGAVTHIQFPKRLWLAFEEERLQQLFAYGEVKETPVLRWLPKAISVGPEAQESRDWDDVEAEDEPAS